MKVVIVGGVAGGATAAARIRRLDEHAEITVFERSGYISYANSSGPALDLLKQFGLSTSVAVNPCNLFFNSNPFAAAFFFR